MLVYILKSTACLAIFFLFYKVFLEKENMHVFKRFYLLGALAFSLIIPALVFTEYVEAAPTSDMNLTVIQQTPNSNNVINVSPALEADVLDITLILWTIYFLGLLFFGLRFIRNLVQIFRKIQRNPKHRLNRITQVLLQEKIPPHTFFSYIFLNRAKLEANEIPQEVILHEETHAQQKHSYDVVLVEFIQVVFWVNPLVYFIKKAIKLNHEFLADQAVLKKSIDKTTYQNTLLSYLSSDSEKKYQPKLANAINYSSIKKRFTVMKTHTSKKAIYLRTLLLLPLLAALLYGFSETKIEMVSSEPILKDKVEISKEKGASREAIKKYNDLAIKYNKQPKASRVVPMEDLFILESIYGKMSEKQKADVQPFPECPQMDKSLQDGASRKLMAEYTKLAKYYNDMPRNNMKIKKKDVERLDYIYGLMSEKQKADAEPFPDFPPIPKPPKAPKPPKVKKGEKSDIPPPPPSNLSDEEFAEIVIEEVIANQDPYDHSSHQLLIDFKGGVSKIPSSLPAEASRIKKGEKIEQIDWVVSSGANRTSSQDKEALPLPPVTPTIGIHANKDKYSEELNTSIQKYLDKNKAYEEAVSVYAKKSGGNRQELWNSYNEVMKLYVNYYNLAKAEGNFVQPMPSYKKRSGLKNDLPSAPKSPRVLKGVKSDIPPPPNPPEPKTPLDYAIEMAKKDAIFYLEGKEITSDKAIDILKTNKDINMDARASKGQRPVIKLSKEPIVIEN